MPFAAFCNKCKVDKPWKHDQDTSHAYMIGNNFSDIKKELNEHFKKAHGMFPEPNPKNLSFRTDTPVPF